MKKIISIALCTVAVVLLVSCEKKEEGEETTIQIPNPFINCDTLKEAQVEAGFILTLPKNLPTGYEKDSIRVIEDEMIEVSYRNGEDELYIRKAKGNEDISGDYNNYEEIESLHIGENIVTTKGNKGKVHVGTYIIGKYTYSIGSSNGLDPVIFKQLIEGIN